MAKYHFLTAGGKIKNNSEVLLRHTAKCNTMLGTVLITLFVYPLKRNCVTRSDIS